MNASILHRESRATMKMVEPLLSSDSARAESEKLHRQLANWNRARLRPGSSTQAWVAQLREDCLLREIEGSFVETERLHVTAETSEVPTDASRFIDWFESLRETGPGQNDILFDWLAEQANWNQMKWFLLQEVAGEAGFDDLVALTQVRFPVQAKLEMARNYWDEMGRGHTHGMHGLMLEETATELGLTPSIDGTVWEALSLANLMVALATNRRYAYQSIGALGVIEMTAPGRVAKVNQGLRRLGVSANGRRYFQLHAGLDVRHSEAWNREVIAPLVAQDSSLAAPIAEGALMRLRCGARCFGRYRAEFAVDMRNPEGAMSERLPEKA